jgi:7-keto-8-aminopelargonate synthetase-like enzyme
MKNLKNGIAYAEKLERSIRRIGVAFGHTTPLLARIANVEANAVDMMGWYPGYRTINGKIGPYTTINGKKLLMLGSNDYLNLTADERVIEAQKKASDDYGSGVSSSAFQAGTIELKNRLEEALAEHMETKDALVYSTGYQANLGAIGGLIALLKEDEPIYADKKAHASLLKALATHQKVRRYPHNTPSSIRSFLSKQQDKTSLIIAEGVYSMEGDIAPLAEIVEIAKEFGSTIFLDDAHGYGVLGKEGRGTCNYLGINEYIHIKSGTFSKALASVGGFVGGSKSLITHLRHKGQQNPQIFSAAPTPAQMGAALKALEIIKTEPERRELLLKNASYLRNSLKQLDFIVPNGITPIIPLYSPGKVAIIRYTMELERAGLFVNPVVHPAVNEGDEMLRLSVMSTHTKEHLDKAVDILDKTAKDLGISRRKN